MSVTIETVMKHHDVVRLSGHDIYRHMQVYALMHNCFFTSAYEYMLSLKDDKHIVYQKHNNLITHATVLI